jgi:hypothetical protein
MLIAIVGNVGSGKTILEVRYAKQDANNGRKIITNLNLVGIPYETFDIEKFLSNDYNESLKDASVFLDELTMYMDCRLGSSKQNLLMGYLVLQSRKRGIDIYATMQSLDLVDYKRFVKYVNMIVLCQKMYVTDNKGVTTELETHRQYTIIEMDKYRDNVTNFTMDIRPYFKYYDTNQIISPVMQLRSAKKHAEKTN